MLAYNNTDAYVLMHECNVRTAEKHIIMRKKCQIITTQDMIFQISDKNSSEQYPSIKVHICKCMIQSDIWGADSLSLRGNKPPIINHNGEVQASQLEKATVSQVQIATHAMHQFKRK